MKKKKDSDPRTVYDYTIGDCCQLQRVFFMLSWLVAMFQFFPSVLIIDATCKTNRFGLPLVLFTLVDGMNRSFLCAMGLLTREDPDSYLWLMKKFANAVGMENFKKFLFVITDGEPSFPSVLLSFMPWVKHVLCVWHIYKNLVIHMCPALGVRFSAWMTDVKI